MRGQTCLIGASPDLPGPDYFGPQGGLTAMLGVPVSPLLIIGLPGGPRPTADRIIIAGGGFTRFGRPSRSGGTSRLVLAAPAPPFELKPLVPGAFVLPS